MPDEGTARPILEAFHLPVSDGRRFCILHAPAVPRRDRAILYVHPFAEEMNKSRRMAALAARSLAGSGWTVLQIDLAGCGDSDGNFADASWERWIADAAGAATWLRARTGSTPWLWGLRAGCLVALEAARTAAAAAGLLFWQPVLAGRQHLQQFLRLRLAADVLGTREAAARAPHEETARAPRDSTDGLRGELLGGSPIEVAGYTLAPAVAAGLDAARLIPIAVNEPAGVDSSASPSSLRVIWLEVTGSANPALSPASRAQVDVWRAAGHVVDVRAVTGPSFWQTQEIEECPELLQETVSALELGGFD